MERKSKFQALIRDSTYLGQDRASGQRALYCQNIISLTSHIRSCVGKHRSSLVSDRMNQIPLTPRLLIGNAITSSTVYQNANYHLTKFFLPSFLSSFLSSFLLSFLHLFIHLFIHSSLPIPDSSMGDFLPVHVRTPPSISPQDTKSRGTHNISRPQRAARKVSRFHRLILSLFNR